MSENPIQILLIEDHEFTRIGLRMSLESIEGIKLIGEAADGQQGLEMTLELKPDVVLDGRRNACHGRHRSD